MATQFSDHSEVLVSFQSEKAVPPTPSPGSEDAEIILLTEVLEEPPSEVVLEISSEKGLEALKQAPSEPAPSASAPGESLAEFLASLKDVPDSPGTPEASLLDPGALREAVRQELALMLGEGELQAVVREAVQEAVAQHCRELFPPVAREVIGQEMEAMKRRLAGIDEKP